MAARNDRTNDRYKGSLDHGVEQIDSSAVALLVTIFRRARTAPNGVRFVSLPSSIMQFAEIYGMDDPLRS